MAQPIGRIPFKLDTVWKEIQFPGWRFGTLRHEFKTGGDKISGTPTIRKRVGANSVSGALTTDIIVDQIAVDATQTKVTCRVQNAGGMLNGGEYLLDCEIQSVGGLQLTETIAVDASLTAG